MHREYKFRETYLVPINDQTLQIINDSRVRAACTRTGCLILAQSRMCSRKVRGSVLRCCILEVRGFSRLDIFRFNRQVEQCFPAYKLRTPHYAMKVKARLVFNEWTPDNTKLVYGSQRFGLGRGALADFTLTGPCGGLQTDETRYPTNLKEMMEEVPRSPWMVGRREYDSLYTSASGNCVNFRPILFRKADKNKTYKNKNQFQLTTQPLPNMNYFSDPTYVDHLIDPMLEQTLRAKEGALEAERHSNKTMMPGYNKEHLKAGSGERKGNTSVPDKKTDKE